MSKVRNTPSRRKRGPKTKGHLGRYSDGTYKARVRVTIDGERVRRWVSLETTNKSAAMRKLRRLAEESDTTANHGAEIDPEVMAAQRLTVRETADKAVLRWRQDGVKTTDERIAALRRHVLGCTADCTVDHEHIHASHHIGDMIAVEVTTADVQAIMTAMMGAGYARRTITHIHNFARPIFDVLWVDGVISSEAHPFGTVKGNSKIRVPRAAKT